MPEGGANLLAADALPVLSNDVAGGAKNFAPSQTAHDKIPHQQRDSRLVHASQVQGFTVFQGGIDPPGVWAGGGLQRWTHRGNGEAAFERAGDGVRQFLARCGGAAGKASLGKQLLGDPQAGQALGGAVEQCGVGRLV